jgi:phosphoribosyl 1,2-cyclic phosphate phosphodiesterase
MHFDHHAGLGELGTLGRSIPVHAAADNGRTGDPAIGAESVASAIRQRYGHAREFSIREHAALEPFDTCGFRVTLIPVRHGDLACFGVRVEDTETNSAVAISGDTDYAIDERSRESSATRTCSSRRHRFPHAFPSRCRAAGSRRSNSTANTTTRRVVPEASRGAT